MNASDWLTISFIFIVFLFLPILLPLYLWYVKKDRASGLYKLGRVLRLIMGVLSFMNAVFFGFFTFSVYLMSTQNVNIASLSREDLALVEKLIGSGGLIVAIASAIFGVLLCKRWDKSVN